MKKLLLLPAAIVVMLLVSFKYAGNWTKYTSGEGHYSISFPGQPVESTEDDTTDAMKPFKIHFATYFPNDSEGYMTDWIDMSRIYPEKKAMKQILEDSRDGAVQSVNATFVTTTATYLGKEPYIEFSFTSKEFAGKGRIYVINKFQYSIITLFSINVGISTDADKFIKSFKHMQ